MNATQPRYKNNRPPGFAAALLGLAFLMAAPVYAQNGYRLLEVSEVKGRDYASGAQATMQPTSNEMPELVRQIDSNGENFVAFLKGYTRNAVVVSAAVKGPANFTAEVTAIAAKDMVDARVSDPDAKKTLKAMIDVSKDTAKFMIDPKNPSLLFTKYAGAVAKTSVRNEIFCLAVTGGIDGLTMYFNPRSPSTWASFADHMVDAVALGNKIATLEIHETIARDFLSQPYLSIANEGAGEASGGSVRLARTKTETAVFRLLIPGKDKHNPGGAYIPIVDANIHVTRTFNGERVGALKITTSRENVLRPYRVKLLVKTDAYDDGKVRGLMLSFDSKIQFYIAQQTPEHADQVILGTDGGVYYKTPAGIYRAGSGADVKHATYVKLLMDTQVMSEAKDGAARTDLRAKDALKKIPVGFNSGSGSGYSGDPDTVALGTHKSVLLQKTKPAALKEPVPDPRLYTSWKDTAAGKRAALKFQRESYEYQKKWLRTGEGKEYALALKKNDRAEFEKLKQKYLLPY